MCQVKHRMFNAFTFSQWIYMAGMFSVVVSAREKCAPGKFRPAINERCFNCPKDTYRERGSSSENLSSCIECADGYVTLQSGSTSQSDCKPESTSNTTTIVVIILVVLLVLGSAVIAFLQYKRYKDRGNYYVCCLHRSGKRTNTVNNQMYDQCEISGGTLRTSECTPNLENNVYTVVHERQDDEYDHCVAGKPLRHITLADNTNAYSHCQTTTTVPEDTYDRCVLNVDNNKRSTNESVTENIYNRTIRNT